MNWNLEIRIHNSEIWSEKTLFAGSALKYDNGVACKFASVVGMQEGLSGERAVDMSRSEVCIRSKKKVGSFQACNLEGPRYYAHKAPSVEAISKQTGMSAEFLKTSPENRCPNH
jgi:hypothetical protein